MDEGDVHISKSCNSVQVWQRLRDGGVLGTAVPQSSHIYAFISRRHWALAIRFIIREKKRELSRLCDEHYVHAQNVEELHCELDLH